jgi:quinol monooxygenase YgiN
MRIVVAGYLKFDGQDCAEIIRSGARYITDSLEEEGCIAYRWAVDPIAPDTIHVFEEWTSERALGVHFQAQPYQDMKNHLGSHGLTGFDVKLYGATGTEPVYTEDGQLRPEIFGVPIDAASLAAG